MRILRTPAGLRGLPVAVLALLLAAIAPGCASAQPGGHEHHGGTATAAARPAKPKSHHPEPRPGITAEHVVRADVVPERARDVYTIAARIPDILDGLYCHCECHEREGRRSLLECLHDDMATTCGICQGQVRMAAELHDAGKSLNEIRNAIDQRYGS